MTRKTKADKGAATALLERLGRCIKELGDVVELLHEIDCEVNLEVWSMEGTSYTHHDITGEMRAELKQVFLVGTCSSGM